MSLDPATRERIDSMIQASDVMLFMKGDRRQPQCGFSATTVKILDTLIPNYQTFDVLQDPEVREGIKQFSEWPTIPQLYVQGEFVGGCDIIQELFGSGELHALLGIEVGDVAPPTIEVSEEAAQELVKAIADAGPERALHLGIDARGQASLSLAPPSEHAIAVESRGVTLHLDALSAKRADGVRIGVTDTPRGRGFQIENPNSPKVHELGASELKEWLDSGEPIELIDVRTPEERARADIPKAVLFSEAERQRLEALPLDTPLVFHCHHGGRSQQAAEHFAALGFTRVYNLVGGIDAWSQQVDPSVPRY